MTATKSRAVRPDRPSRGWAPRRIGPTLPITERQVGSRRFELTPFLRFLHGRLAQLAPLLHRQVKMRVALHRHPGVAGIMEAAVEILQAIPGMELVDLKQPGVGLQSVNLGVLPAFKRKLRLDELQRRAMRASMRSLRSIIPIIASYARTSAAGRSA